VTLNLRIRPVHEEDVEAVVGLSLVAWVPVFHSFRQILGEGIYHAIWPEWQKSQRESIEGVCRDTKTEVLVAEVDGRPVGFVAYELHREDKTAEVVLLAVDPAYQNRGIGTELNRVALEQIKESGIELVRVETGGDPSHAPARRSYEKAGYTGLPLVRYFKKL
jgi:ribosomal protein S18 acetylase RimI-like enzyme